LGPACCLSGAAIVDNAVFDVICWWPVLVSASVACLADWIYVRPRIFNAVSYFVSQEGRYLPNIDVGELVISFVLPGLSSAALWVR